MSAEEQADRPRCTYRSGDNTCISDAGHLGYHTTVQNDIPNENSSVSTGGAHPAENAHDFPVRCGLCGTRRMCSEPHSCAPRPQRDDALSMSKRRAR
jgi:hypothetical protein